MNRFLFILVLIVVGVVCLGFYMEWFQIGSDSGDGKTHVTFTVDQNKIKASENKVGIGHQGTEPVAPVPAPQSGN